MDCSMKGTDSEDQESRLWEASRMYVAGEIDVEKFEEIESSCTPDIKKAMMNLSRKRVHRDIIEKMNPFKYFVLFRIG